MKPVPASYVSIHDFAGLNAKQRLVPGVEGVLMGPCSRLMLQLTFSVLDDGIDRLSTLAGFSSFSDVQRGHLGGDVVRCDSPFDA